MTQKTNKGREGYKKDREEDAIRLNKYIASSGLCSRRKADEFISEGKVKVNGETVTDLGIKVNPKAVVEVNGKNVKPLVHKIYILLNKPKDTISTVSDDRGRRTVIDILPPHIKDKVHTVGRLDRATTGLILLTNDGDFTQRITHPSYNLRKIYRVSLNKILTDEDVQLCVQGIELEDGAAHFDEVAYVDGSDKSQVGVVLHSGKNRVIRRLFEALGYQVEKLDRVMIGSLTKKGLERGQYRELSEKEVRFFLGENKTYNKPTGKPQFRRKA